MNQFRLAVVASHPTQHFAPVFRVLGSVPGLEIRVYYWSNIGVKPSNDVGFSLTFNWDVDLLNGYRHCFSQTGMGSTSLGCWKVDDPLLPVLLDEFQPNAIWIFGYNYRFNWRAIGWARDRCPILHLCDASSLTVRPALVRIAKKVITSYIFRRFDIFITVGERNEEYYSRYGVPREKMIRGALPIDVNRFLETLSTTDSFSKTKISQEYGLNETDFVVLSVGKLISRKRVKDLVAAIALLRKKGVLVSALLIGEGELRSDLERQIAALALGDQVKLVGFINQKEMPALLACGDALAMTSDVEQFGMAVTEAMVCGNVIIASDQIGCVGKSDPARPGVNALIYPYGNVQALANQIEKLYSDPMMRMEMSAMSRKLAFTQDISVAANAVLKSLIALRPKFKRQWSAVDDESFDKMLGYLSEVTLVRNY